jgi:hypothetical protein
VESLVNVFINVVSCFQNFALYTLYNTLYQNTSFINSSFYSAEIFITNNSFKYEQVLLFNLLLEDNFSLLMKIKRWLFYMFKLY